MPKELAMEPLDPNHHRTHWTWEEFLKHAQDRNIIDYDGFGELASAAEVSNVPIAPSEVNTPKRAAKYQKPEWATHVVWYNR